MGDDRRPTFITDWPPMAAAMRRSTDRKIAIANDPDAIAIDTAGEEEPYSILRQLLSGTDVDLDAVLALMDALKTAAAMGLSMDATLASVLNGVVIDAFLIGFWTREEMIP